ncbi:hypothetical protein OS493_008660 [Desmophyllum pertusum]|uniref:Uncharacterized protein n=1 Tax=Desmophyllum pertusum TaxID=174260 RepID=A0A9W9ZSV5_9CNID|nr:hypothetical protein OS493_008660 [Desmophyllum pertusum]
MLYGEGVSNIDQQEFLDQICPKPNSNDRKYVRIKTFDNKYVWANPTHKTDNSYLRTRCCGGKDAVGRKDVTVPGRRTTFIVHCQQANNQNVFRFEILGKNNYAPSGYFFYANPTYYQYGLYAYKPKWDDGYKFNFIIQRWRGPVVGIRMQGKAGGSKHASERSNWLKFSEDGDGYVSGYNNPYRRGSFPSMADAFTLEAVPSGCVDGAAERSLVLAAPAGTSHEECESKQDRCYWTSGWKAGYGVMLPGTCYYNKDSTCHWRRSSSALPINRLCVVSKKILMGPAAKCEAANCCFDYRRKQCYKPL